MRHPLPKACQALLFVLQLCWQARSAWCFGLRTPTGARRALPSPCPQQATQALQNHACGCSGGAVRMSSEPRPRVTVVSNSMNMFKGRFVIQQANRKDLDTVARLCVDVFFGVSDKQSPWKAAQYRQLYDEQLSDLTSRASRLRESVMFKAMDTKHDGEIVGFIEVSTLPGTKYGMGDNIPEADVRPVISNLAVSPRMRRFGIGSSLLKACQEEVLSWGYQELVLQVEEDNAGARAFYQRMGFDTLFVDRAARRYDTSGFLLQNVRCSKLTLRKLLPQSSGARVPQSSAQQSGMGLSAFFDRFLRRPAVPPPRHQ